MSRHVTVVFEQSLGRVEDRRSRPSLAEVDYLDKLDYAMGALARRSGGKTL